MSAASGPRATYSINSRQFEAQPLSPGLYIVATPIGNLGDISLRALATLAGADLILCEDTRVTSKLLSRFGIKVTLQPYHDHNAAKQRPRILERLRDGASIVLVSDAGTPLVSDPGYKLVTDVVACGHDVHMVPGPSAPLMALALSGLPSDRFMFCGFLSSRQGQRRRELDELCDVRATLILFESTSRLPGLLEDIRSVLGDRRVAVARELTKLHEEVLRGTCSQIVTELSQRDRLKGEITLVVAPPELKEATEQEITDAIAEALTRLPVGKAAAEVARQFGLARKSVYSRALALKETGQ